MNKVVSIQIAGQVFWIDEGAYETLRTYLQTVRGQLAHHESAAEIYEDIELRIAELLYAKTADSSKAVSAEQLDGVIEQVGYIDDDEAERNLPRRSYRDRQNRILGGVCAGLAVRFDVPALVLRLGFLVLTGILGLGIVLYLILWLSLESNDSRRAALASQGKAPTAQRIATFEAPKARPLEKLQKILFLPVRMVGLLAEILIRHYRKRRRGYAWIGKNLLTLALLMAVIGFFAGLLEFVQSRLFPWPIAWLLGVAAMYLLVLGAAIYVRHVYLARPAFEIKRALKLGALLPAAALLTAILYVNLAHSEHQSQSVEQRFTLDTPSLNLHFTEAAGAQGKPAAIRIRPAASEGLELTLHIDYSSYGLTPEQARRNLHAIDYEFSFEGDTLQLGNSWSLRSGALRRGQSVQVTVEVPRNVSVNSSLPLIVDRDARPYLYVPSRSRAGRTVYVSRDGYLHETGDDARRKLDPNERVILENTFCEEFFLSESWRCASNIELPVAMNPRFDRALLDEMATLEELRRYLLPDRSLSTSDLAEMKELLDGLGPASSAVGPFRQYVQHLLSLRAGDQDPPPEPG